MPTTKELVLNRPLAGSELAKIILSDTAAMLEGHGLLANHLAWGRVSYELRLTLHLDLPSLPESIDRVQSRSRATDIVEANPALAAIEGAPPLAHPSPTSTLTSDELHRDITSPNVARLEHGLPVQVSTRDQDGHVTEHLVQYPESYPGLEPVPATTREVTSATRAELGLPAEEEDAVK